MELATVSCPLKSMGIFSTVKKVNLKEGGHLSAFTSD